MKKKILFILSIVCCALSFQAQDAIDGGQILMHFPFDNDLTNPSSGTTLVARTAAVVSAYDMGKFGNAALFNGKPYVTSGSTFDSGASFTIAVWVKFNSVNVPSGTGTPKIIHQDDVGATSTFLAGRPLQLSGATRPVNTSFGEASAFNSTTLPAIDDWVHIAIVMDKSGGTVKMYINGVEESSKAVGANIVANKTNNGQLNIGSQKATTVNGLLNGYLDDLMITTEVLTANQVKAVMNLGVAEAQTAATNIWLGTTGVFETGTNWSQGTAPVLAENVVIPSGVANNPTAAAAVSAKNIIIQKNASLDVGSNNITATSTTVHGGGSLIAKGTVSGTFTYNVITNAGNTEVPQSGGVFNPKVWNMLSSPVVGETYDNDYILDNFIGTGTGANRAIALYDNTTDADGDWDYFQASVTPANFDQGIGFSTRKKTTHYQSNNEEVYPFVGTFPESNVNVSITQGAGNSWNLIGNPFPSYIRVSELLDAANGAGMNKDNVDAAFQIVYVWDPATETYPSLASTDYIAPGQGFFVRAANSTPNNFSFLESLQSHQTGVTFYKSSSPRITLNVKEGDNTRVAYINYASDYQLGLDAGNDIGMFTGVSSNFAVYTELLENNKGIAFERQALPTTDFESMIVPLGVIAKAGKQITFSAEALNLPSGIDVYLEDRQENTYTKLSDANTHSVTLATALNGTGRFYMHTSASSVLSLDSDLLDSVSIYKTNNSNLRITGLEKGRTNVSIYNLLGKQVMTSSFDGANVNNVSLPSLATGIYLVKVQTEKGEVNKKIILE